MAATRPIRGKTVYRNKAAQHRHSYLRRGTSDGRKASHKDAQTESICSGALPCAIAESSRIARDLKSADANLDPFQDKAAAQAAHPRA